MKQNCKEIVEEILPSNGFWWKKYEDLPLGSKKLFFENIPYHACDIEWIKKYIKNYLVKQFSFLKLMAINKYLESKEFLDQVREYQLKIIDWQIAHTDFHSCPSAQKVGNLNAKQQIDEWFDKVFTALTVDLKMDETIVKDRLEELKPEQIKKLKKHYKNNKHNLTTFANIAWELK